MILFCPDLVGKEEVKAMLIGNGDFVRPVLHPCIKEGGKNMQDAKKEKIEYLFVFDIESKGWWLKIDSIEKLADYHEKTYHPEERNVYDGYIDRVGMWRFCDEGGSVYACDKEFGTDKETVYDVVTAWMPKEQIEPYKEEIDEN